MANMTTFSANSADTRKWAQTEHPAPPAHSPDATPPSPTREDEQRFSQTTPPSEDRRDGDGDDGDGDGH